MRQAHASLAAWRIDRPQFVIDRITPVLPVLQLPQVLAPPVPPAHLMAAAGALAITLSMTAFLADPLFAGVEPAGSIDAISFSSVSAST